MTRRLSVREARATFSEVLGSVYHTGEPVIVERNGKPVAVLISLDEYERMRSNGHPATPKTPDANSIVESIRGIAGKLDRPLSWEETMEIAYEDRLQGKLGRKIASR